MTITHWIQLLFVALKLTGYISWSWWFVMSPAILFFALIVAQTCCEHSLTPEQKYMRALRKKYDI